MLKIGDVFDTKQGEIVITRREGTGQKYHIKFKESGFETTSYQQTILKGTPVDITRPHPNKYYGVGYTGVGKYKVLEHRKCSSVWSDMLKRCYYKGVVDTRSKGVGSNRYQNLSVKVCDEWMNMQTFAEWFYNQKREDQWHLDKDIINPGSKVYCPENCVFIPAEINTVLVTCNARRGDLPLGVSREKRDGRFRVIVSRGPRKGLIYQGGFSTPEEAFLWYKRHKEEVIRSVAQEHFDSGNIQRNVYDSLMNWEVVPFPE